MKEKLNFIQTLASASPIKQIALIEGHHFLNSIIQFAKVDFGTITI